MSKMTYKQVDHARARITSIKASVVGPAPKAVKQFSLFTLCTDLLEGNVALRPADTSAAAYAEVGPAESPRYGYNSPTKFVAALVASVYEAEISADQTRYDAEKELYDARANNFRVEAQRVEDSIVLGDCAEALRLLAGLAEFSV